VKTGPTVCRICAHAVSSFQPLNSCQFQLLVNTLLDSPKTQFSSDLTFTQARMAQVALEMLQRPRRLIAALLVWARCGKRAGSKRE
jgi:hypothetical protein